VVLAGVTTSVTAQEIRPNVPTTSADTASSGLETASSSAIGVAGIIDTLTTPPKRDLTKPEEAPQKNEIQILLERRPAQELSLFNFFAFWVQKAIELGIPANTIVLLFLIPVIATLVTFTRVVIGLPALEMLVPIILSFAFVAVGIITGLIIITAVICASFLSRALLRHASIMFFPKRSLSLLILSLFVFAALTIAIMLDIQSIRELSIFPVLILTLLGDSIVSVQLRKPISETAIITGVTIALGLIGYILATSLITRDLIILWPELILLTIPVNFMLGRYFGLRLMEVFRFNSLKSYGSE
jgi:hypothetical protein